MTKVGEIALDFSFQQEIVDFLTILSPKSNRNLFEDADEENRKKKVELILSATSTQLDDSSN